MGECYNTKGSDNVLSAGPVIHQKKSWDPGQLGPWKVCDFQASCFFFPCGLHRCPAWAGLFSITGYNAMTNLCKTAATPHCLHFQEARFLGREVTESSMASDSELELI